MAKLFYLDVIVDAVVTVGRDSLRGRLLGLEDEVGDVGGVLLIVRIIALCALKKD
jgi:hypothetical protein